MRIHFSSDSLKVTHKNRDYELHPIWLRERLPGNDYIDKDTNQRLYEPSSIKLDLKIKTYFDNKIRKMTSYIRFGRDFLPFVSFLFFITSFQKGS